MGVFSGRLECDFASAPFQSLARLNSMLNCYLELEGKTMGSFRAASKGTTTFSTVFQHFAEDQTIVLLRASILNVIYESINRTEEGYPRMRDTKETIDPRDYERLRSSILPNLYYGSFNLTKSRTL
jgi:hypothetical protein